MFRFSLAREHAGVQRSVNLLEVEQELEMVQYWKADQNKDERETREERRAAQPKEW